MNLYSGISQLVNVRGGLLACDMLVFRNEPGKNSRIVANDKGGNDSARNRAKCYCDPFAISGGIWARRTGDVDRGSNRRDATFGYC